MTAATTVPWGTSSARATPSPSAPPVVEDLLIEHLNALHLRRFLDQAAEQEASATGGEIAQRVLVELQQTDDSLQRLVSAVAEGVFTPAEAHTVKLDRLTKKERLEARLTKLRARAQVRDELRETVAYVQDNLPGLVRGLDGTRFRQIAGLVFEHVVAVGEGSNRARVARIVSHTFTEPFRALLMSSECYVLA